MSAPKICECAPCLRIECGEAGLGRAGSVHAGSCYRPHWNIEGDEVPCIDCGGIALVQLKVREDEKDRQWKAKVAAEKPKWTSTTPYPEKVSQVLHNRKPVEDFTERDFLDLAMAALDQGGVSAAMQDSIRRMIVPQDEGWGPPGPNCIMCGKPPKVRRICGVCELCIDKM